MKNIKPIIVDKTPFGKTGLFKVTVEYSEDDIERFPYDLPSEFITKELKLEDNSSGILKLNPVLTEVFINREIESPYLNTAKCITIQNSTFSLFFEEATGDFRRLKRNNINVTKGWIGSIIKGLTHLHLRRIIHGDIRISNILIFDGVAKLNNFGSSALIMGNGNQRFKSKMFTPTHRPPELWSGNECNLSADIWALGCTIYEMIYGQSLFNLKLTDDEYQEQMKNWIEGKFETHPEWNNPINGEINNLILTMLNPNPDLRPTIFQILNCPIFQNSYEPLLDTCFYSSLDECSIVSQRVYDQDCFKNDNQLMNVYNYLKNLEENDELRLLIVSITESYPEKMRKQELVVTLHVIAHLITYRGLPHFITIDRKMILNILEFSNMINFHYIDLDRFYGVKRSFLY